MQKKDVSGEGYNIINSSSLQSKSKDGTVFNVAMFQLFGKTVIDEAMQDTTDLLILNLSLKENDLSFSLLNSKW